MSSVRACAETTSSILPEGGLSERGSRRRGASKERIASGAGSKAAGRAVLATEKSVRLLGVGGSSKAYKIGHVSNGSRRKSSECEMKEKNRKCIPPEAAGRPGPDCGSAGNGGFSRLDVVICCILVDVGRLPEGTTSEPIQCRPGRCFQGDTKKSFAGLLLLSLPDRL